MNFKEYLKKTEQNALEEMAVLDTIVKELQTKGSLSPIELRAAKASLHVLIENSIGKSKHLLRHFECPVTPVSAHDSVRIMRDVGMIDDIEYQRLSKAIGFRNAMIHDYMNFKPEVLVQLLRSGEHRYIAQFLIQPADYSALILKRLKGYAPIS